MEKITFFTKFKRNTNWEIDKVMDIINHNDIELLTIKENALGDTELSIACTEDVYNNVFSKLVEEQYPGVCDFNYLPKRYYFKRLGR